MVMAISLSSSNSMPTSIPLSMEVISAMLLHKTGISGTRRRYGPTYGFVSPRGGPGCLYRYRKHGYPILLGQDKTPMAAIKGSWVASLAWG